MGGPGKGRQGKSGGGNKDKDKKDSGGEGGLLIIQKGELHPPGKVTLRTSLREFHFDELLA